MEPVRSCCVCGEKNVEVLQYFKMKLLDSFDLPPSYDIVICNRCNFIYADTTATQDDYDRFYASHNIYEGEASYSDKMKYKSIVKKINERIPGYPKKKILEIGFANGEVLKGLLEENKLIYKESLYGLDTSASCVSNLSKSGINCEVGSLLNHNIKQRFDIIIMSHVLEHILDVDKAMNNIKDLLKVGGEVYIEVPNVMKYMENNATPFSYFDHEHINHFGSYSLKKLMERHNLKVIEEGEKEWEIGRGRKYPACWILARLVEEPKRYIKEYISKCLFKKYPEVDFLSKSKEPIIVWGVGSFTERLFGMHGLSECNIKMYVDDSPSKIGSLFNGSVIESPESIKSNEKILILSVYYSEQIRKKALTMGLKNDIVVLSDVIS